MALCRVDMFFAYQTRWHRKLTLVLVIIRAGVFLLPLPLLAETLSLFLLKTERKEEVKGNEKEL